MSSKIDVLVKKVELFEKLATQSNRSNFLKRLAQETIPTTISVPSPVYPGFESHEEHSSQVYKTIPWGTWLPGLSEVQKALAYLYPAAMQGSVADGIFGQHTQSAMNLYRADHHDNRAHADRSLWKDIIMNAELEKTRKKDMTSHIKTTPVKPLYEPSGL